jgi:hypothetical protein
MARYRRYFSPAQYQDALQFLAVRGIELKKSRATSEQGRQVYISRIASGIYKQEQSFGTSLEQASKKEREEARKAARGHAAKKSVEELPRTQPIPQKAVVTQPPPPSPQKKEYHRKNEKENYTAFKGFHSLEEIPKFDPQNKQISESSDVELVARGKTKDGVKTGGKRVIYMTLNSKVTWRQLKKTIEAFKEGRTDIVAVKQLAKNYKKFDSVQSIEIRVRRIGPKES